MLTVLKRYCTTKQLEKAFPTIPKAEGGFITKNDLHLKHPSEHQSPPWACDMSVLWNYWDFPLQIIFFQKFCDFSPSFSSMMHPSLVFLFGMVRTKVHFCPSGCLIVPNPFFPIVSRICQKSVGHIHVSLFLGFCTLFVPWIYGSACPCIPRCLVALYEAVW